MFQIADYKPSEYPADLQTTPACRHRQLRAHMLLNSYVRKKKSSFTLVKISHMPVATSVNSVSNFMHLFIITEIISLVTEWEQNEKREHFCHWDLK